MKKTNIFAVKIGYMELELSARDGLATFQEMLTQIARLYDKGIMPFLEKSEYVRPSTILEKITVLPASDLSTMLKKSRNLGLVRKTGHFYSLNRELFVELSGYLEALEYERFDSNFATWFKASKQIDAFVNVHGWIVCVILTDCKHKTVTDLVDSVNEIIRAENILRPSTIGKPQLFTIQQPAMTQVLKALVSTGIISWNRSGKFSQHFVNDSSKLALVAHIGYRFKNYERIDVVKPSKKNSAEGLIL